MQCSLDGCWVVARTQLILDAAAAGCAQLSDAKSRLKPRALTTKSCQPAVRLE